MPNILLLFVFESNIYRGCFSMYIVMTFFLSRLWIQSSVPFDVSINPDDCSISLHVVYLIDFVCMHPDNQLECNLPWSTIHNELMFVANANAINIWLSNKNFYHTFMIVYVNSVKVIFIRLSISLMCYFTHELLPTDISGVLPGLTLKLLLFLGLKSIWLWTIYK